MGHTAIHIIVWVVGLSYIRSARQTFQTKNIKTQLPFVRQAKSAGARYGSG